MGKGHRHGTHDGNTGFMRNRSSIVGVIHQILARPGQEFIVRHRRFAEIPWVAWRSAMRPHQRAEASELEPAHIHGWLRKTKISAEIAAPIRITARAQVQSSGQDVLESVKVCRVIAGKLADPSLRAGRCPSGIQNEIVPTLFAEYLADRALIVVVVDVVHLGTAPAIVKDGVIRHQIAEVHHASGFAKIQDRTQRPAAEFLCVRVGEINVSVMGVGSDFPVCKAQKGKFGLVSVPA